MKRFAAAAALLAALAGIVGGDPAAGQGDPAEQEALGVRLDASAFPEATATLALPPSLADADLAEDAFIVVEDGRRRPAVVTPLRSQPSPVVVMVDTSGSMVGPPMTQAKAAASAFVAALPPAWPVAVIGFGPQPSVVAPFTTDRSTLAAAIDSLTARGETALYDAVALTGQRLAADGVAQARIVLLSDGGDTVSSATLESAIASLGPGLRLEIVELVSPESNHSALARLAEGRGGRVTSVADGAGLTSVYERLAREFRSEYVVRFRSRAEGPVPVTFTVRHGTSIATATVTLEPPHGGVVAAPADRVEAPAPAPVETGPEPAPASPEPRPDRAPAATAAPLSDRRELLLAGGACVFVALLVGALVVALPDRRRFRVLSVMGWRRGPRQSVVLSEVAARAVAAAETVLERRGRRRRLNDLLERAGVALRPGELLVLVGSGAAASFVLGSLVGGPLAGLVGAGFVGLSAYAFLRVRADRRRRLFSEQLPDAVQMLAGALRAGYALTQAVDSVAKEAPSPSGDELHRIVVETRLGRDLNESLRAAAARVASQDFDWVVQAIEIQRDVGGDLAEVLDNVAGTIRERVQLHRHVKALTAEGRFSAYVLLALPPFLALALSVMNPDYLAEFSRGVGRVMVVGSLVLMTIGGAWFKKLCRLDY